VYQNAGVVITLKNQIAELEEEKGNLQLQLLDADESKSGQCYYTSGHMVLCCIPFFMLLARFLIFRQHVTWTSLITTSLQSTSEDLPVLTILFMTIKCQNSTRSYVIHESAALV